MRARRAAAVLTVAGILGLGLAACGGGEDDGAKEHPTSGPEYEQAMERCALSRLQNGGVEEPSTQSGAYLDAYTACTYGRSFDDVSAPARGWGPADPDYWDE